MSTSRTCVLAGLAAAIIGFGITHAAADSSRSLVCCKADTGWKIRNPLKLGSRIPPYHMVPATECTKEKGRVVIGTHLCQSACRKRGTDWVWKNNRCQRSAVRDKRGRPRKPTFQECRKRGEGWIWIEATHDCRRASVRDKRRGMPSISERRAECIRRGKGWVWINERVMCQRSAVRDKRRDANLVCCKIDATSGIGSKLLAATVGYADYRWGMIPETECRKKNRQIVPQYQCIKSCERAGKDWVWDGRRCKRSAVRDKRGR